MLSIKDALLSANTANWKTAIGPTKFIMDNSNQQFNAYFNRYSGNITLWGGIFVNRYAHDTIFVIAHEVAHSMDYQDGEIGSMGRAFLSATGETDFNRFKRNCMRHYTCRSGAEGEAWADAFAALVTTYAPAYIEPPSQRAPLHGSRLLGYNWDFNAVAYGARKTLFYQSYISSPIQLHQVGDR